MQELSKARRQTDKKMPTFKLADHPADKVQLYHLDPLDGTRETHPSLQIHVGNSNI